MGRGVSGFIADRSFVNRMIFPAPPPSYDWSDFPGQLGVIRLEDGSAVAVLLITPDCKGADLGARERVCVVYLHGNGSDIGVEREWVSRFAQEARVNVLMVDYPGYGASFMSRGLFVSPTTEAGAVRFARAAYHHAVHRLGFAPGDVVIWGHSIGTGIALALAASLDDSIAPCALVLQSPFSGVRALATERWPMLGRLVAERFPSVDNATRLCPDTVVLVIHGSEDVAIPMAHGEAVFRACRVRSKRMCVVHGTGHSDFDWRDLVRPFALALATTPNSSSSFPPPA